MGGIITKRVSPATMLMAAPVYDTNCPRCHQSRVQEVVIVPVLDQLSGLTALYLMRYE